MHRYRHFIKKNAIDREKGWEIVWIGKSKSYITTFDTPFPFNQTIKMFSSFSSSSHSWEIRRCSTNHANFLPRKHIQKSKRVIWSKLYRPKHTITITFNLMNKMCISKVFLDTKNILQNTSKSHFIIDHFYSHIIYYKRFEFHCLHEYFLWLCILWCAENRSIYCFEDIFIEYTVDGRSFHFITISKKILV